MGMDSPWDDVEQAHGPRTLQRRARPAHPTRLWVGGCAGSRGESSELSFFVRLPRLTRLRWWKRFGQSAPDCDQPPRIRSSAPCPSWSRSLGSRRRAIAIAGPSATNHGAPRKPVGNGRSVELFERVSRCHGRCECPPDFRSRPSVDTRPARTASQALGTLPAAPLCTPRGPWFFNVDKLHGRALALRTCQVHPRTFNLRGSDSCGTIERAKF